MPAVILPYLARKITSGQLRRLGLGARVFSADEALAYGLVQRLSSEAELDAVLRDELSQLLDCSPEAQKEYKTLQHLLMLQDNAQSDVTVDAIAKLRTSPGAQAGLKAFFDKTESPWSIQLPAEWKFDD